MKDKIVKCGWQRAQAVKLLTGFDENIFCDAKTTQTPVCPSHAFDRLVVALRHNDEQVHVTTFIRSAPRV